MDGCWIWNKCEGIYPKSLKSVCEGEKMKSRVALVYLFIGLIKWSSIRAVYFSLLFHYRESEKEFEEEISYSTFFLFV